MHFPATGMILPGPAGSSLQLEECLGDGAFGFVFKAQSLSDGTYYAVKFPKLTPFNDDREEAAFLNEAIAAGKIQHPNVVQVVHVEIAATNLPLYLVMEFISSGTLKQRLDALRATQDVLDLAILQAWTTDLVEGIAAINEQILHRDLKPDNILVDGGTLKINDFGLAKIIGAATRSRTFKGGQHMLYMAPEGWRNETNTIQLDMYSLGIVLYEMASLQYPYQLPADRSDDGLRNMHFFQQPQPLQTLRPDLPLGFCHVVTRLMEKNPSDRFPTWADVQKELKAAWEQSLAPGPRVDVSVLLKESDRQREAFMRKQLAEEQRRADQAEQEQLDRYQMQKLKDQFKAVIDEYNDHCYITDKIKIEESALGLDLLFPYRSAVFLKSFPVDPPMNLKVGQVRIAAVLQDKKHSWLNYLLCRQGPDDYYGTWKVCVARDYTPNRRPEPFGFANPQEIRQIEHANQITTTLTAEFHDRVQESFLEVIQHAMKQPE